MAALKSARVFAVKVILASARNETVERPSIAKGLMI